MRWFDQFAQRAGPLQLGVLGAVTGFFAGFAVFIFVAGLGGVRVWGVLVIFPLVSGVFLALFGATVMEWLPGLGGRLYFGGSGAVGPAFSHAESLIARGRFREAFEEYTVVAERHPGEVEPLLRIGRLLRDQLDRPEEALEWLRRARAEAGEDVARQVIATREIVELLIHRLGQPERALPELARLAARFPGTPVGEWAFTELMHWKAVVHGDDAGTAHAPPERHGREDPT